MSKALKSALFVIGLIAAAASPAKAWYFYSSGSGCWICNSQNVCDYVHDGNCISKATTSASSARLTPVNKAELERLASAKFGSEAMAFPADPKAGGASKVGGSARAGGAATIATGGGALPAGKYNKSTTLGTNGGCKNEPGHAPCGDYCCINNR